MTRLLYRNFNEDKYKVKLYIISLYVVCMSYGGDVRSTTFYDQQTADYIIIIIALNFNIIFLNLEACPCHNGLDW